MKKEEEKKKEEDMSYSDVVLCLLSYSAHCGTLCLLRHNQHTMSIVP